MPTTLPLEIDAEAASQLINEQKDILLVDCREPDEYEICHIEGAQLIPMRQIKESFGSHDDWQPRHIVVYCHHGIRSLKVVHWLRDQGFNSAQSLSGGIDQWSQDIDANLPRY